MFYGSVPGLGDRQSHLQLHVVSNAPHMLGAPTLQSMHRVSKLEVQGTTSVGVGQRSKPSSLHDLKETREFWPDGFKVEPSFAAEVDVCAEDQRRMVRGYRSKIVVGAKFLLAGGAKRSIDTFERRPRSLIAPGE
jgi:hypothetical protein